MRFVSLLLLSLSLVTAESFSDFVNAQNQGTKQIDQDFEANKKALQKEFETYKAVVDEEFKAYKKSLSKFWDDPTISDSKKWVEYSKDKKSRQVVDFENDTITVEVHAKNKQEAQKAIAKNLLKTVAEDTKQAYDNDELAQNIDKRLSGAVKSKVAPTPILAPLVFNKPPTVKDQVRYATSKVKKNPIKEKKSKIPNTKRFTMTVKMPSDATQKRAAQYLPQARKEARLYKIPLPIVMAIMHSESSFNPMAKSHIPAFGLMQVVPSSAGVDAYMFLYKKRKVLSSSYLYNPNNNIKIGTAYLHILYYRYLKSIKDEQNRLYAVIAAYNTGAGNVAKAFTGKTNPSKAAQKINTMSPKAVYNHMRRNLPYDETKNYLKKVSERVAMYQKLYGNR